MAPSLRKLVLAVHLTSSLGWIGTVMGYIALGVTAATTQDAQTVRAAWIAMELTGWVVIVPLAMAALVSGVVISVGTPWGLIRHYWVLISLVLTVLATVILLLHMPSVTSTARIAREADGAQLNRLGGDLGHAVGGLLVLLVITVLNVYKPRGLTPYGWRKQEESRGERSDAPSRRGLRLRIRPEPLMHGVFDEANDVLQAVPSGTPTHRDRRPRGQPWKEGRNSPAARAASTCAACLSCELPTRETHWPSCPFPFPVLGRGKAP